MEELYYQDEKDGWKKVLLGTTIMRSLVVGLIIGGHYISKYCSKHNTNLIEPIRLKKNVFQIQRILIH